MGFGPPVILGTCLVLGAFLLVSAYQMYPAPDVDSGAYLPQAVNLACGRGLVNPIFDRVVVTDPTGRGRQYYYPPLFGVSVAALMPEPTPRGAFLAVALLDAVGLVLSALLLLAVIRVVRPGSVRPHLQAVLACLALAGLAGHLKNSAGRPDSLAGVLVAASALVAVRWPRPRAMAAGATALLAGLTGATHPFAGLLLGLLAAGYILASHRGRAAVAFLALLVLVSSLTFITVDVASGTDPRLLFHGLVTHARISIVPAQSGAPHFNYWVTGIRFPLLGVLLATSAAAAADLVRTVRPRLACPVGVAATIAAAAAAIYYLTLRAPTRYYNLALFAPLAYAVLLAWTLRGPGGSRGNTVAGLVFLLFLGTAGGLIRRVLLYPITVTQAPSWGEARADLRRIATDGERILVTHSLWVLSEDYDRMRLEGNVELPCHYDLFLKQQAASGLREAPELPGHKRIFSSFSGGVPTLLTVPLAGTVGGYGFAAYVPTPEQRALADCTPTP